jgi:phosphomannomutase
MEYGDAAVNEEDGLKLDLEDYWIHIRKSNTEPIIRIIAEARTLEEADKICFDLVRQINNL